MRSRAEPQLGFEPRTDRLQGGCSTPELLWQQATSANDTAFEALACKV